MIIILVSLQVSYKVPTVPRSSLKFSGIESCHIGLETNPGVSQTNNMNVLDLVVDHWSSFSADGHTR